MLPIAVDFKTIWLYLAYLQELAKSVNSKYVNVVMGMGAAINASKMIWNFPGKFGNIVIHPGDFHLMKENFQLHYRNAFILHILWKMLMFWQCFDINLSHVLSSIGKADYNFVDLDKLNIDYCRCFILCRLLVYWFTYVVFQSGICSSGSLKGVLVRSQYS